MPKDTELRILIQIHLSSLLFKYIGSYFEIHRSVFKTSCVNALAFKLFTAIEKVQQVILFYGYPIQLHSGAKFYC